MLVMLHRNRKQVEKNYVFQPFMELSAGNCRKKANIYLIVLMSMQSTMPTLYYCEASYKQQKIKTKNSDYTKARLAGP